ncbi:MAG: hypothetical protein GWO11_05235 [Desulfuromonadales bacterium]|nr:hypothetical protein [Desulfuromonadales bacterium]NIR33798.1 hypothetical protein [Desulfuromonadales bacterium]NIS42501.1 hypothetical protein [Desulfuromonadales bacterium]
MITLKILEKAIERRDYRFLAVKIADKLREYEWDDEDIRNLSRKLDEQAD